VARGGAGGNSGQGRGPQGVLILDNLRVHHSKPVKAWLAVRTDKMEVFYLPCYCPELNPEAGEDRYPFLHG